jgi:hypothetical protein
MAAREQRRDIFEPVALNAKTGFVYLSECKVCGALVRPERAERHENGAHPQKPARNEGTQRQ